MQCVTGYPTNPTQIKVVEGLLSSRHVTTGDAQKKKAAVCEPKKNKSKKAHVDNGDLTWTMSDTTPSVFKFDDRQHWCTSAGDKSQRTTPSVRRGRFLDGDECAAFMNERFMTFEVNSANENLRTFEAYFLSGDGVCGINRELLKQHLVTPRMTLPSKQEQDVKNWIIEHSKGRNPNDTTFQGVDSNWCNLQVDGGEDLWVHAVKLKIMARGSSTTVHTDRWPINPWIIGRILVKMTLSHDDEDGFKIMQGGWVDVQTDDGQYAIYVPQGVGLVMLPKGAVVTHGSADYRVVTTDQLEMLRERLVVTTVVDIARGNFEKSTGVITANELAALAEAVARDRQDAEV
jgi:hypothetical protein